MFNITASKEGAPEAVLIRAIEPIENLELMLDRREMRSPTRRLTAGPGSLSKALGITTAYHGHDLCNANSLIWLESGIDIAETDILASPRVGIAYAEEWIEVPWRFRVKSSKWTSPAK